MALFTKSVQEPSRPTDGIRICIMRRPGEEVEWDIWMPHLAPSSGLLNDYHAEKVNWKQFEQRFESEVLIPNNEYLRILVEIAQNRTVTILCWESTPDMCHRRLVAQACKRIAPELEVTIV